jgi:predicted O-methyltransferase YrrM
MPEQAWIELLEDRYDLLAGMVDRSGDDAVATRVALKLLFVAAGLAFKSQERKLAVFWEAEQFGAHFLPVHFYSPLPSKAEIPESAYSVRFDHAPGLLLDPDFHRELLLGLVGYAAELKDVPASSEPTRFHWNNPAFAPGDAVLYYGILRLLRPRSVIEIGCGYSSLLCLQALERSGAGALTCIEPYENAMLTAVAQSPRVKVLSSPVQSVSMDTFENLEAGDILFIDSSHVSKIGSDVNFEVFQVLPRLKPGVVVHVHDIFLPWDYPRRWVEDLAIFWNEQYVLAAFLALNPYFDLLVSNQFSAREASVRPALNELTKASGAQVEGGGSLWFVRNDRPLEPQTESSYRSALLKKVSARDHGKI